MTSYILAAINAHLWASVIIVVIIAVTLGLFAALTYRRSQSRVYFDRTHNGPYRPPPADPDLPQRAKDAVAEYRERQKLDAIAGRPLKGRRT